METKRQKTAALWKACFDDTDEYIQFYFDRKYGDKNTLLHEENGQAIAALQMLPYPMNWAGTTLRASYISGACTLPEARNRGIMTRLLAEAFLTMARRSIDLTFLIPAEPWLYGYYGKTGYAPVFEYTPETFTPAVPPPTTATLDIPAAYSDTLANSCYPYFDREMQKRPDSIQHPFDDFSTVLRDLYASGGRLLVAKSKEDSSGLTGLAFALPEENHVRISELLGNTPEIRAQLLHAASRLGNGKPVTCKLPAQQGKSEKRGMARIIQAEKMLARFAACHPQADFTLQLTDALLPANNGYYTVVRGNCSKHINTEKKASYHMDIATLTQALLGGLPENPTFPLRHPYLSLMLD